MVVRDMNKQILFKVKDYSCECPECNHVMVHDITVNIGNIEPKDYGYSQVDTLQTCTKCGCVFQQDVDVTTVKEDFL